jgi:AP2 domain
MTKRMDPLLKMSRAVARRKKSAICLNGDVAIIELLNGGQAVIDAADVGLATGVGWSRHVAGTMTYAVTYAIAKGRRTYLHRRITGASETELVDHADMDGLNNRRRNLRFASKSENGANRKATKANTTGIKGIIWYKQRGKWVAQIHAKGKRYYLGIFKNQEDAARAYALAAKEHFGEFARTA